MTASVAHPIKTQIRGLRDGAAASGEGAKGGERRREPAENSGLLSNPLMQTSDFEGI